MGWLGNRQDNTEGAALAWEPLLADKLCKSKGNRGKMHPKNSKITFWQTGVLASSSKFRS